MNKFIYSAFLVCALAASVHCNYNSYSSSPAAPASVYDANSYSLGAGSLGYDASPISYAASPSYAPAPSPSYAAASSYAPAKPKITIQPAYATELYPGQNNYKTYNSAPVYSQVALPVVPSAPLAKLYVPAQQRYASSNYASY